MKPAPGINSDLSGSDISPVLSPFGDPLPKRPVFYVRPNSVTARRWWQVIRHHAGCESVELDFMPNGNQAARIAIKKNLSA